MKFSFTVLSPFFQIVGTLALDCFQSLALRQTWSARALRHKRSFMYTCKTFGRSGMAAQIPMLSFLFAREEDFFRRKSFSSWHCWHLCVVCPTLRFQSAHFNSSSEIHLVICQRINNATYHSGDIECASLFSYSRCFRDSILIHQYTI